MLKTRPQAVRGLRIGVKILLDGGVIFAAVRGGLYERGLNFPISSKDMRYPVEESSTVLIRED